MDIEAAPAEVNLADTSDSDEAPLSSKGKAKQRSKRVVLSDSSDSDDADAAGPSSGTKKRIRFTTPGRAGRAPRLAKMSDAPSRGVRRTTGGARTTQLVLDFVDDEAQHEVDSSSDEEDEPDSADEGFINDVPSASDNEPSASDNDSDSGDAGRELDDAPNDDAADSAAGGNGDENARSARLAQRNATAD